MWTYLLLFWWSFLAATVFPISVEAYFVYIVHQSGDWVIPSVIAGLGNVLGSLTVFYLGWKGGEYALRKLSIKNKRRIERASKLVQKYGAFVLILSWVPLLGDVLVAVAGALRAPLGPSVFFISLGKIGRFVLLGWITLGLL